MMARRSTVAVNRTEKEMYREEDAFLRAQAARSRQAAMRVKNMDRELVENRAAQEV